MKRLCGLLLACAIGPAMAAGVHVDDIEYQDWLDKLAPNFTRMISAIEYAKNAGDEVDSIDPGTTVAAFCAILFPTSGTTTCDAAGEEHYDVTDSLQSLVNRTSQLYNCATNQTCNAASRLTGLRKHTNETQDVALDTAASKYQPMFDTMNSTARALLSALLETNVINELADEVEIGKTPTELCNQLFAPNEIKDCTAGGGGTDKEINRTQDLIDAAGALDEMYDCANNVACGTGDRLIDMRQFVEVR